MNILKHKNKVFILTIIVIIFIFTIFSICFYKKIILKQPNISCTNETTETSPSTMDNSIPIVKLSRRYLFTNNIRQPALDSLLVENTDTSDLSAKLIRFEKYGALEVLNERTLKALTDTIPLPSSIPELEQLGTETLPSEEGIYRTVMKITDSHGNYSLEELFVIYDTTGAYIEDTPDKTITVKTEDLNKEPALNKKDYIITDNVDGKIDSEYIRCELELRDKDKHEWLVHVSYTDRAGNISRLDFLIIVKEEPEEPSNSTTPKPDNIPATEELPEKSPDDAPQNTEEINPYTQAMIDAGYGNVVDFGDGTFGVLMPDADVKINGKDGSDILREYLAERGLVPKNISGGWHKGGYYCYIAKNITELITPDNENFWD